VASLVGIARALEVTLAQLFEPGNGAPPAARSRSRASRRPARARS